MHRKLYNSKNFLYFIIYFILFCKKIYYSTPNKIKKLQIKNPIMIYTLWASLYFAQILNYTNHMYCNDYFTIYDSSITKIVTSSIKYKITKLYFYFLKKKILFNSNPTIQIKFHFFCFQKSHNHFMLLKAPGRDKVAKHILTFNRFFINFVFLIISNFLVEKLLKQQFIHYIWFIKTNLLLLTTNLYHLHSIKFFLKIKL